MAMRGGWHFSTGKQVSTCDRFRSYLGCYCHVNNKKLSHLLLLLLLLQLLLLKKL
jgi:hypothetical protein